MGTNKKYGEAFSLIIIIAAVYWSISSLMPKKIPTVNSTDTEFSIPRALVHLKEISKKPHYVGTENHSEVRAYIISELEKLGLKVEVQSQFSINNKWRAGSHTKNIITKIKGTKKGKSILLLSHYDSAVHSSLGASDAGSGVVTILEGLRAFLASNPKHENDIVILISDAEEIGLLGANAFVKHHPWAKNVGLVLNFEARGSGGPSFMLMETNGGNKNMVQAFNQAKPKYPVASSLLYSVYKMLPNDTDLTVFRKEAGINGYNFAFIDDHFDYHTAQDTYERLDINTLQHQAEYLMPLLRYFSNSDLDNLNSEIDLVYFNFPGFTLINYPFSWIYPMVIIAGLLFIVLLGLGIQQKKLSVKSIFIGFIPFLLALILTSIIVIYGWKILLKVHPQYQDILHGFTYNGHFYITAFVAITIGINLSIYNLFFKNHTAINLSIAPIFIWILFNILIANFLPGAGFFIIPIYLALLILGIGIFTKSSFKNKIILFAFLSIPLLLLFSPQIQTFPIGLGLKMMIISVVIINLVFSLLIPIVASYQNFYKLNKLFFLIAILSIISASFTAKYSQNQRSPNSIVYELNANNNEAMWASYNIKTDEFTHQFLGDNPNNKSFVGNVSSSKYNTSYKLFKKTKLLGFSIPIVNIIKDTIIGEDRRIRIKIIPQRKVSRLEIISNNSLHIKKFELNGEKLIPDNGAEYIFTTEKRKHLLTFYFTKENEIIDLSITIPKKDIPDLEIIEASYDLFTNPKIKSVIPNIVPRNEIMIPMPFVLNDAIIIKMKIEI